MTEFEIILQPSCSSQMVEKGRLWFKSEKCPYKNKAQLFELNNIQFHGLPSENPNVHLTSFIEVCDIIKYGVTEEALRLQLFPLSLNDRAKHWLTNQPPDSITSWNDLVHKFLTKFFPPSKIAQLV